MKHEELIVEFEQLAGQMGVEVRYEKGDFDGGYCILKSDRILLLNKKLMNNKKASVFALALHEIGLDNVFIKPVVREYIEDEVARMRRESRKR
jgi:hypothetical protein